MSVPCKSKLATAVEYDRDRIAQTRAWANRLGFRITLTKYRSKAVVGSDDNKDAKSYCEDGYKEPPLSAWDEPHGIGIVTGPIRNGPADVDIDCPEALFFAERFLPRTDAIFGRPGKLRSHWLYLLENTYELAKEAFLDPLSTKGATIIEMRGDNHQTIMPGSIHEGGELIWWSDKVFPQLARVRDETLIRAVKKIAIAVLVVRHMWSDGPSDRNEVNKCLCGLLYYQRWPLAEAEQFIRAIMEFKKDDDKTRIDTLRLTFAKGENDRKIVGATTLKTIVDERVVDRILDWLGGGKGIELLERFNNQYAVVKAGNSVRIHEFDAEGRSEFFKFQDFHNFHSNEYVPVHAGKSTKSKPAGQWWTGHPQRRTHAGVCLEPGKDEVVGNRLNLWRGFGVEPRSGDWSLMNEHLFEVMSAGDEEFYNYLFSWLAWTVQNPGKRAEVALVFRGKEGTGRGILGRALCRIFGPHSVHLTSSEQLTGKFNKHLAGASFVFADEAHWAGDKKAEKRLYGMITEEVNPIEPKGVDTFFVPNMLHIMKATNEEWSVPAGQNARRFAAQLVSDAHMQDFPYFKALQQQLDDGGLEAMLYDLLHFELGDWHPREGVPQTRELEFQKEQTDDTGALRERLEHYLQGACEREEYTGGVKVLCHMVRDLVGIKDADHRGNALVGKAMRELGFERRKVHGNFYVRGEADWVNPHLPKNILGFREIVIERDDTHKWNVQLEGSCLLDDRSPNY